MLNVKSASHLGAGDHQVLDQWRGAVAKDFMGMPDRVLPYHEPGIVTILTLSPFLLVLNLVGYGLDKLIYSGLVGQNFIGVAWGDPGGQWLSVATQEAFVQLGYLGLILIVYEGGLSTNYQTLKANLCLSVVVALTGIATPIGMSFILMRLVDANPLQAFAAGAALCSTSLGTTFIVLKNSGLTTSRLGVVLTSAAMLDDIVGLVMVQIISNLGDSDSTFHAVTVVRPIGVSIAFAVVTPLLCAFVVKPIANKLPYLKPHTIKVSKQQIAFLLQTMILIGFVVASSYAGTSNLFAAYLAGVCTSWYGSDVASARKEPLSTEYSTTIEKAPNAQGKADHQGEERPNRQMKAQSHSDIDTDEVVPSLVTKDTPLTLSSKNQNRTEDDLDVVHEAKADIIPPSAPALGTEVETVVTSMGMPIWEIYCETCFDNLEASLLCLSRLFNPHIATV